MQNGHMALKKKKMNILQMTVEVEQKIQIKT